LQGIVHPGEGIMAGIGEFMINYHKHCDDLFAAAEEAVGGGDWTGGAGRFEEFAAQMERHFDLEDNFLFPKFDERTGHSGGPTMVMKMEHNQMRVVIHEMRGAIEAKDKEQYLGQSETLLVLMQQHNYKEEAILYNMIDQLFGAEAEQLVAQLEAA
jgi:iron-sulfur cluster repair protein YtfE (RIC family)